MERPHPVPKQRGVYAIIAVLLLFVLLGFAALAIDFAYVERVDVEAHNAADAGALAAGGEFRRTRDVSRARLVAKAVAESNPVGGSPARLDANTDIVFGSWDFQTQTFDENKSVNAVSVRVRRTEDSPAGQLPLFIGPIIGHPLASVQSGNGSVAALRTRQIMMVQDITGSFKEEIPLARQADLAFLTGVADLGFPTDDIGMAVFTGDAQLWTPLQNLRTNLSAIQAQWSTLNWCDKDKVPDGMENGNDHMMDCRAGGDGTNQGAGLTLATDQLALRHAQGAVSVIVLVSDGKAQCIPSTSTCDNARYAAGRAAADYAWAHNVHVFSVSFNDINDPQQTTFLRSLVRGDGKFYETPDANQLPIILDEIARNVPLALVR